MIKHATLALIATLMAPAAAFAQLNVGDELGATETEIRAALEAQDYIVSDIEIEDGEIEVEALTDRQSLEIKVSPDTGLIVAVYDYTDVSDDDN